MAYFNNINTLEQLRKQYRDLLKIHHPDNGGNVADMQEINTEYDKLFKSLKDKHESKATDARNKKAWHWHSDCFRKRSHKTLSMDAAAFQDNYEHYIDMQQVTGFEMPANCIYCILQ